jgi:CRISPR-associated DxTHG motif protein
MKKAVITILGTAGTSYNKETNKYELKSPANYIFKGKDNIYYNTLPFLIDNYSKEYEIISLFTPEAKQAQDEVLKEYKHITYNFNPEWQIDVNDFDSLFNKMDTIISKYDKVIVDISHGFRHLPMLMIIDVIMHNIIDIDKVEQILFTKEIDAFKKYEIIDIKRYLDLANISYALNTFDRNYTGVANIKVSDTQLNEFLQNLSQFSKHILANSLDELLRDTNRKISLTKKLISEIENLQKSENSTFKNLDRLLEKTLNHIKEIDSLKTKVQFERVYGLSKNMFNKNYFLNSITLLSEAIGMYCLEGLKTISQEVEDFILEYEKNAQAQKNNETLYFKVYELYNKSKVFYKRYEKSNLFNGIFLEIDNRSKKSLEWNEKAEYITTQIKKDIKKQNIPIEFIELVVEIDDIRNNLAHANSSKRLEDVEQEIKKVLDDFEKLCIKRDILKVKPNKAPATRQDIDKLQNFSKIDKHRHI